MIDVEKMTLDDAWRTFHRCAWPRPRSDAELRAACSTFYAGALAVLSAQQRLTRAVVAGEIPMESLERWMNARVDELARFAQEGKRR